jgi:large subunit ribosomal protein L13
MKTYSPKPDHIERRWFVLDASGQVLGRLATEAAVLLRGKHKPIFAPHMDTGDHVVVINADKVELTGNKARDKVAYRHSGYPGGITGIRYGELLQLRPVAAVEKAVRGMLPKNRLGRQMIKKLHVVAGGEHPHAAQKPIALAVGQRPAWDGLPAPRSHAAVDSSRPASGASRTGTTRSAPAAETATSAPKAKRTTSERTGRKPAAKAAATGSKRTSSTKRAAAKPSAAKKTTAASSSKKKSTAKKTTSAKKTSAKKTQE